MTNAIDRIAGVAPAPSHIGQATAIEQSRAVAEVHAAVVVAQQRPRNIQAALAEMEQGCRQRELADRAFYAFPRAGQNVSGPSIHLARELARCFGNLQYGIAELRRDDEAAFSEMQAWAWDLQTNTRTSTTFVAPHKRDTKKGVVVLTDMRDIYESNSNLGARRVREMIFAVLPPWFVERAKNLCHKTLTDGGGKPLPQRVADAVKMFEAMGITVDQIEQRIGRPSERWNEHDVAQLGVTYRSLQRNEISRDEAFPEVRLTAADIVGSAETPPAQPAPAAPDRPAPIQDGQRKRLHALVNQLGYDRDTKIAIASEIADRSIGSTNDLTQREAALVIAELERLAAVRTDDQDDDAGWPPAAEPGGA